MRTYFNLPQEYSDYLSSRYVIVPVPFEGTVSYGKGTAGAPDAICNASHEIELYDYELDSEPFEAGISTHKKIVADTPESVISSLKDAAKKIIADNKIPIIIGGEHSISLGPVTALKNRYPDLSVLQVDAHADLRDEFDTKKNSHACIMRRISDLDIPIVQVGIRSMSYDEAMLIRSKEINTHIVAAKDISSSKDRSWIDEVTKHLSDHVYITIDVDGLDPSIMPATGTPEPGGILWYDMLCLIKQVISSRKVVGSDIVELAPIEGMHAPDVLCAQLLYKLIGYHKKFSGD